MWTPIIAQQLRQRGHDVESVAERADLRGQPDATIFAIAQLEGRAILTENVRDFRALAERLMRDGHAHAGLIFTSNRTLPRGDARALGRAVIALDELLSTHREQNILELWLT
jgi:hypothetical protein